MSNWSEPQRQSAFGIFMFAGKAFREVVALLLIMTGSLSRKEKPLIAWIILFGSAFLYIFGKAFLQYFYFRFHVSGNQLIIQKGIFSKKTLVIPFAKIQTVQLHQNFLHKIIGHCKVNIDTAGTEKVEVAIHSITYKNALALKEILSQQVVEDVSIAAPAQQQTSIHLNAKDLFKIAVSANHLETFGLIIAFMLARFNDVKDLLGIDAYDYLEEHSKAVAFTAQAIGIIAFFTLIIAMVISVLRIILKFADLSIQLNVKGFTLRHGLLNSHQQFIGARKIQFILWKANWIRRKIGMYMFYVKTAGEDDLKKKQRIHVPVTRNEHLQQLAAYYQTELPSASSAVNAIQKQYISRTVLLKGLPVLLLAVGSSVYWWGWYSCLFVLWFAYYVVRTIIYQKNMGIWVNEHAVEISTGVWGREKLILNWNKLQLVTIRQSIYQRRNDLATLSLFTASGEVKIPYLLLSEARVLADYAAMKAESSQQNWM